jgi:hypothetical protein
MVLLKSGDWSLAAISLAQVVKQRFVKTWHQMVIPGLRQWLRFMFQILPRGQILYMDRMVTQENLEIISTSTIALVILLVLLDMEGQVEQGDWVRWGVQLVVTAATVVMLHYLVMAVMAAKVATLHRVQTAATAAMAAMPRQELMVVTVETVGMVELTV